MPSGVHGTNRGMPIASRPALIGWKPSTSFFGSIRSTTARSLICIGRGSWTRMPWTSGSAFSRSSVASSSSCDVSAGRRRTSPPKPTSSLILRLFRT